MKKFQRSRQSDVPSDDRTASLFLKTCFVVFEKATHKTEKSAHKTLHDNLIKFTIPQTETEYKFDVVDESDEYFQKGDFVVDLGE